MHNIKQGQREEQTGVRKRKKQYVIHVRQLDSQKAVQLRQLWKSNFTQTTDKSCE